MLVNKNVIFSQLLYPDGIKQSTDGGNHNKLHSSCQDVETY